MGRSQGSSHRARMSSARFSKEDTEMSSVGPGSESPGPLEKSQEVFGKVSCKAWARILIF